MCKYLLDLIGFNVDEPEDYYDSKMKDKHNFHMLHQYTL